MTKRQVDAFLAQPKTWQGWLCMAFESRMKARKAPVGSYDQTSAYRSARQELRLSRSVYDTAIVWVNSRAKKAA